MMGQTLAYGVIALSMTLSSPGFSIDDSIYPKNQFLTQENFLPDYLVIKNDDIDSVDYFQGQPSTALFDSMQGFVKSLLENSVDLSPEIVKLVNDNFWDLI